MIQLLRPVDLHQLLTPAGSPDSGARFTDDQLDAITAELDRPISIIAGAGSGKTSVMAARVVWLVASGAVEPEEILGLTFTRKATAELSHRIVASLERIGIGRGAGQDRALLPSVSTYDSFSKDLVKEFGPRAGLEGDLRLMHDATRFQLAARCVQSYQRLIPGEHPTVASITAQLIALESELSAHRADIAEIRQLDEQTRAEAQSVLASGAPKGDLEKLVDACTLRLVLLDLVEDYREAKKRAGVVQFSDITASAALVALEVPQARATIRERFKVVLLDEYQDTSVAQREMLVGLFGGGFSVTAVGDPCQAIYGWRGASVANITRFLEHFDLEPATATRRSLRTNMRSGGRLLAAANEICAPLRATHPVQELESLAHRKDEGSITVARLESYDLELDFVVSQVRKALDSGRAPEQIAILSRGAACLPDIQAALLEHAIPAEIIGISGLLHVAEVADVIATLQVVADPTANPALLRLLTGPRWRIGMRDLVLLGQRAELLVRDDPAGKDKLSPLAKAVERGDASDVRSLAEAMGNLGDAEFSAVARQRFSALSSELAQLRARMGEPLPDLVSRICRISGLDIELEAHPRAADGRGRVAMESFLDVVSDYRDPDGGTGLAAFLSFIELAKDEDRGLELDLDELPAQGGAVQLMTMHKAKGLEWDVVIVPMLYETSGRGGFPSIDAGGKWTSSAKVLPWELRGDSADLPVLQSVSKRGLDDLAEATRERAEIEERRVAYVAFTRARHELVVSGHAWGPSQKRVRDVSRYLQTLKEFVELDRPDAVVEWYETALRERPAEQIQPPRNRGLESGKDRIAREAAVALVRKAMQERAASVEVDAAPPSPWSDLVQQLVQAERVERATDRIVRLPLTLSASQMMRLAAHPEAFALDLARPVPQRPSRVARRGTEFHSWVEDHFGVRAIVDLDDLPGAADEREPDGDFEGLRAAFLASPWAEASPLALEESFILPIAGRVLVGRIDAIFRHEPDHEDSSTVHIIDWKTGIQTSDPLQLAIYRLAWANAHGVDPSLIRAGFFYARRGETVWHDELADEDALVRLFTG